MRLRLPSLVFGGALALAAAVAACQNPRPAAAPAPPRPATAATPPTQPANVPPPPATSATPADAPRAPGTPPGAPSPGGGGGPIPALRARIGERASEPANVVFENVKVLGSLSAGELLTAMEGFSRSLGVRCSFCHVPGQWASDERGEKDVTRGMVTMTHAINTTGLREAGVGGATVSCWTCHRGSAHPEVAPPEGPR